LRYKGDQISGFTNGLDVYGLFKQKLETEYPELLAKVETDLYQTSKKRKWTADTEPSLFTFNFF
jgi:hypothetical protein